MQDDNEKVNPMPMSNEEQINISDIFSNRGMPLKEETPSKVEETKPVEEKETSSEEVDKEPEQELDPIEQNQGQEIDYQAELEKIERRYKDSQKWGNDMRKKLAAYEKAIKKFSDEGTLSTEEAETLLDYTKFEDVPPEEETLFLKYARIWDDGLERMREFADDPDQIDKYALSFKQLLSDSSLDEQEEIFEQFKEIEDNKPSMTRKMLKIGKEYFDEVFGEVYESGSIKNFKKKVVEKEKEYNKKIDKLQKEIDKLKKKYEDYTEPTYKLPSGGSDNSNDTRNYSTDPKSIFMMR